MRLPKILLMTAAFACASTFAAAAPGNIGAAQPAEAVRASDNIVEARHTYRHWRRQQMRRDWRRWQRWQRHRHWRYDYPRYRYYDRPRCYWSYRWQRRICRY